jgi:hypothetical protein
MARLKIDGSDLVVKLSLLEKMGAFHGNIRVPLSAVRAADADPEPWSALRGIRAPGTGLPGVIALGVRRYPVAATTSPPCAARGRPSGSI